MWRVYKSVDESSLGLRVVVMPLSTASAVETPTWWAVAGTSYLKEAAGNPLMFVSMITA